MYDIKFHEDESVTIDVWRKRITAARQVRPNAWFELIEDWRTAGGVLDFDASPVQALFCDLRIDGARAIRMLDARGETTAAPIDPTPEMAEEGESQLLMDELVNEDRTFEAVEKRLGMDGVDFGDPEDVKAFVSMREALQSEGKILPGIRGYLRP